MDNRVLLAIILSIGILIFFQYIYMRLYAPPQGSSPISTENQSNEKNKPLEMTNSLMNKELPNTFTEKIYQIKTPLYEAKLTNLGVRFKEF
ncbi:MAG: hypothetical protein ACK4K4_04910, partial [Caldimicrobium sp.]